MSGAEEQSANTVFEQVRYELEAEFVEDQCGELGPLLEGSDALFRALVDVFPTGLQRSTQSSNFSTALISERDYVLE